MMSNSQVGVAPIPFQMMKADAMHCITSVIVQMISSNMNLTIVGEISINPKTLTWITYCFTVQISKVKLLNNTQDVEWGSKAD